MMEANISDLQHFSTGDGPGIRSTIFFKGCNLNCEWCHNPETISSEQVVLVYDGREKVCGRYRTENEVMNFIMEDKEFYDASGGGVTLSGGEPLLQADFCREIAKKCGDMNIPVIIDTAANVRYDAFQKVLPYVSQFYVDLKGANEDDYVKNTKGSLAAVEDNLTRLVCDGADVVVRIPIIPGYNDTEEYCRKLGQIVLKTGVKTVHLLPFHRLGTGKYKAMGLQYRYENTIPLTKEEMNNLMAAFPEELSVKIDG